MVHNELEEFDKAFANGGLKWSAEVANDIFIILIQRTFTFIKSLYHDRYPLLVTSSSFFLSSFLFFAKSKTNKTVRKILALE